MTKCSIDETPAKIWGGKVCDIGGRDHRLIRGAGVAIVLHTVRIDGMTQVGASGIFCQALLISVSDCFVPCVRVFDGVPLDGVLWTVRGAADLVGVFAADVVVALVGVEGVAVRDDNGSLGRRRADDVSFRFCSRYARSFLYTRGGHGGLPRSGGSFSARLSLRVGSAKQKLSTT